MNLDVIIERFLWPDSGLPLRLLVLAFVVLLFVRGAFIAITTPTEYDDPAPADPGAPSPVSWWPWRSTDQRLQQAAELAQLEADMLRRQADAARAKAELRDALRDLGPAPNAVTGTTPASALNLTEIQQVLALADIADEDRHRLAALFIARIEDKLS